MKNHWAVIVEDCGKRYTDQWFILGKGFTRYFNFLVERGFLGSGDESSKRKNYRLTKKGEVLLQKLHELEAMVH